MPTVRNYKRSIWKRTAAWLGITMKKCRKRLLREFYLNVIPTASLLKRKFFLQKLLGYLRLMPLKCERCEPFMILLV